MQSDIRIDGRVFAYVFPCAWEDYAKIGFSRDPLGRISALHRRWFEFFDLDAGALVEAESERDARDLELQLRSPFKAHRAPAPMTVQDKAGGHTEWVRGANQALSRAIIALGEQGYRCYPLKAWLRAARLGGGAASGRGRPADAGRPRRGCAAGHPRRLSGIGYRSNAVAA